MFCRKCGNPLPDRAAFCNLCGNPVQLPSPIPAEAPPAAEAPETVFEPAPVPTPAQPEFPVQDTIPGEPPADPFSDPQSETGATQVLTPEQLMPQPDSGETQVLTPEQLGGYAETAPAQSQYAWQPEAQAAPARKPAKPRRKRPPFGVRALMQLLSLLLSLVLLCAILATAAVADLRNITSADGLKKVFDTFLSGPASHPAPTPSTQLRAVSLSEVSVDVDDIPDNILANGDVGALADWLYTELKKQDSTIRFTQEEFRSFVEESTIKDYATSKLAGFAEDVLNGTENTEITTEEIIELLEENERQLKSELNIELNEETLAKIETQVTKMVEEQDLNGTIRNSVTTAANDALKESVGVELEQVQNAVRTVTSDLVLIICIALCVLLLGLLLLANYYNMGAGLSWASSAGIVAGLILSLPLLVLRFAGDVLANALPALESASGLINSFTSAMAFHHYSVLAISFLGLIGSIVWRILSRCRRA